MDAASVPAARQCRVFSDRIWNERSLYNKRVKSGNVPERSTSRLQHRIQLRGLMILVTVSRHSDTSDIQNNDTFTL